MGKLIIKIGEKVLAFENYLKSKTGNPIEVLGKREDLTPEKMANIAKKFKDAGATILGGCCETRPSHIEAMTKLK